MELIPDMCGSGATLFPCLTAWLHLQAWPDPVFEGDALTLRCHGSTNKVLSQVKFYKDGKLLQTPKTRWSLSVGTATLESSGQYSCSGKVAYVPYLGRQTSELVKVQVQEPFPPPVLSAVPSPELREGSPLTLRCQTKLYPQKSASRLLFSFHRDASTLQDRGPHPELCLPGAQERDSGLYWCRATLEGGVAQKQSPQQEVRVQGEWQRPVHREVHSSNRGEGDAAGSTERAPAHGEEWRGARLPEGLEPTCTQGPAPASLCSFSRACLCGALPASPSNRCSAAITKCLGGGAGELQQ
ncbi:fc receptor-like protein 6- [Lynx pardinus]|uniref:Fc receptor-like protein 6 n=1 Tax=Lynx pardinus TaxID=191816 RepID=A0A485PIH1_LYNPA|nr:fc receptor-like protein 6- [Lynx pardinus]